MRAARGLQELQNPFKLPYPHRMALIESLAWNFPTCLSHLHGETVKDSMIRGLRGQDGGDSEPQLHLCFCPQDGSVFGSFVGGMGSKGRRFRASRLLFASLLPPDP